MKKKILVLNSHIFYCLLFHVLSLGTVDPKLIVVMADAASTSFIRLCSYPFSQYILAYSPPPLPFQCMRPHTLRSYHFGIHSLIPLCLAMSAYVCAFQHAHTCLLSVCLSEWPAESSWLPVQYFQRCNNLKEPCINTPAPSSCSLENSGNPPWKL